MTIETPYNIGDMVYLITDVDQKERMVTQITIRPNNCILYDLSCGNSSSWHYGIELSTDKNWKL